jgi:shikimate kinase
VSINQRLIVIAGFMGSGKTTVARALASELGCEAFDLDESIARAEQRSPKEIIEQDGEDKFREIETRALVELLKRDAPVVVSLGGGTWTIPANRQLLAEQSTITVWLDAPFELCWNRIEADNQRRPLAPSQKAARKRYQERLETYALADFRVPVRESEGADEIAQKIASLILPGRANS